MSNNTKSLKLTDENFQREVLESQTLVIVDFWAPWCGPCRILSPTIEALAQRLAGRAKVGKLNIDDYEHLATQYNIQAIQTLLFFQNGQVVERVEGIAPLAVLEDKLNALQTLPYSTQEKAA